LYITHPSKKVKLFLLKEIAKNKKPARVKGWCVKKLRKERRGSFNP